MMKSPVQTSSLLPLLLIVLCSSSLSCAFYLPGVAPEDYPAHAPITVKAEKLNSVKTQLPFEYFALRFCEPKEHESEALNLGEIMHGSRVANTAYTFNILENKQCRVLCTQTYNSHEVDEFSDMIEDDYRANLMLDNLPLAMQTDGVDGTTYEIGYPLGLIRSVQSALDAEEPVHAVVLYNHLHFTVLYHEDESFEGYRIVGFEVSPTSVKHDPSDPAEFEEGRCNQKDAKGTCSLATCSPGSDVVRDAPALVLAGSEVEVIWTYDVEWKPSNIKWASRWDTYLQMQDEQVHWFSILNSFMIVLFLSGLVAMIMLRALKNDLDRYARLDLHEDATEETGWKLVHGDVFRPPQLPMLLSVYVGTGVQVLLMTMIVMAFALLGFLSPANRGALLSTALFLFVFMGIFGGYHGARIYKMFKGQSWKKMTLLTAVMFPGAVFALFFVLNLAVWGKKSSGAVPFGTLVALLFMWFGISAPLVYFGSYFGFRKAAIEHPVRTNQIPRSVPPQPWYMHPALTIVVGGILPFGAVFVELFFILSSVWLHQFYYLFGFLFLVLVILALTCAEITIVMCYFQLCTEDYHWWWRAYLTSGSCALYMFLYSVLYFFTRLELRKPVSSMLFFGYMLMCSYTFFIVTGTIGFYACFFFVRKIYATVKVD